MSLRWKGQKYGGGTSLPSKNRSPEAIAFLEEAIECFKKCTKMGEGRADADSCSACGGCYWDMWKPTDAKKWFKKALKINPRHPAANSMLMQIEGIQISR